VDAIEEEEEIQRMLIPYAVDRVLDETMKALELIMVPRPGDWRREGTGNWAEDDEPEVSQFLPFKTQRTYYSSRA
jgi:hypothetical protein